MLQRIPILLWSSLLVLLILAACGDKVESDAAGKAGGHGGATPAAAPAAPAEQVAAAAEMPDPGSAPFSLSIHTSPGAESVIHRGEPLLVEVLLILTGEEAARIALANGAPWTQALSLALEDDSGKKVEVEWTGLEQAGTELAFTTEATEVRAIAGLSPEQLKALAPAKYLLTASLDTRETAAPGAWKGQLVAQAVPVSVSETAVTGSDQEMVLRQRLLARWHQLNKRPEEALRQLDAALEHVPEDITVLSEKAELLAEMNRNEEAIEVLQQAVSLYYQNTPDPSHPPRWLLHRLRDLETYPVPATGAASSVEPVAQTAPPAADPPATAPPATTATSLPKETPEAGPRHWVGDEGLPATADGQWAVAARAGSQYGADERSASRATGAPDVPGADDHPNAWCPAVRDSGSDWLELTFERPAPATEVRVRQSFGPGAIVKVEAIEPGGQAHTWWEGIDPFGQEGFADDAVWFSVRVPLTSYEVQKIRLTLDLGAHGRWKQIDAVQLIGDLGPG